MPLKHGTETRLVVLLGALIAVTGAVCAFLPPVSVTVWPWLLAFALSLAYPLALYPMMKERRADHEFRALHFVPALMLLLWLAIDLVVAFKPEWQMIQSVYTWGWAGALVVVAFILIVLFCLKVVRQRVSRVAILAGILVPFLVLAQFSDRMHWDRQVAMTLWDGEALTGSGLIAVGSASSNLAPSSDSAEEHWREQLRRMERRRNQIAQAGSSSSVAIIAVNSVGSQQSSLKMSGSSSSAPPHLPSSGFGPETIALVMAASCCASIHRKTVKRVKA